MKSKLLLTIPLALSAFLFSGCEMLLNNRTPKKVHANPSGIYAIEVEAKVDDADINQATIKPSIVIDGQKHAMYRKDAHMPIYCYDYRMPHGDHLARYYYEFEYDINQNGQNQHKHVFSKVYDFELINRYITSIKADRGIIGATVPVVGQGFTKTDQIRIGDVKAKTYFQSPFAMVFEIPPLPADKSYPVYLDGKNGSLPMGELYVDAARISANHKELSLKKKERRLLLLNLERPAPKEGLVLDVTTDIPDSIVMPEIKVAGGSSAVNVWIEGADEGKGKLYIGAPGYSEIDLPLNVASDKPQISKLNQVATRL